MVGEPLNQSTSTGRSEPRPARLYGAAVLAAAAAVIAVAFATSVGYWGTPFAFALLYLTHRIYTTYINRVNTGRPHVVQTPDLHLATIEALARAIDAKDQ